jgi:hypothetical protein
VSFTPPSSLLRFAGATILFLFRAFLAVGCEEEEFVPLDEERNAQLNDVQVDSPSVFDARLAKQKARSIAEELHLKIYGKSNDYTKLDSIFSLLEKPSKTVRYGSNTIHTWYLPIDNDHAFANLILEIDSSENVNNGYILRYNPSFSWSSDSVFISENILDFQGSIQVFKLKELDQFISKRNTKTDSNGDCFLFSFTGPTVIGGGGGNNGTDDPTVVVNWGNRITGSGYVSVQN